MGELHGVEWLPGHVVNGTLREFYHLCPGAGCAIGNYLWWMENKRAYLARHEDISEMQSESCSERAAKVVGSDQFKSGPQAAVNSERSLAPTSTTRTEVAK